MTVAARAGSSPRWAVPSPVRRFVPVALFVAVATATVAIVDKRPDIARAGDSAAALAGELLPALCWSRRRSRRRRGGREPASPPARGGRHRLAAFRMEQSRRRLRVHGGARAVRGLAAAACPGRVARAGRASARATGSGALDRRLCDEPGDARAGRRRGLRPTRAGMPRLSGQSPPHHERCRQLARARAARPDAQRYLDGCLRGARLRAAGTVLPAGRRAAPVLVPAAAALALFGRPPCTAASAASCPTIHGPRAVGGRDGRARARGRRGRLGAREGAARRSALARLVVDLGASPPPGGSRASLRTLGDPSLRLLHSLDGEPGWIDSEGQRRPCQVMPTASPRAWWPVAARSPCSCTAAACSTTRGSRRRSPRPLDSRSSTSACTLRGAQLERLRLSRAARRDRRRAAPATRARPARRGAAAPADAEHRGPARAPATWRRRSGARARARRRRERARSRPGRAPRAGARPLPDGAATRASGRRSRCSPSEHPGSSRRAARWPLRGAGRVGCVLRRLRGAPAARRRDVTIDARRDGGRLVVEVRTEAELIGEPTAIEDRVGALGGALIADVHHLRAELPCGS